MVERITRLLKDEEGASMVEYGLLVALIAAISIVMVGNVGQKVLTAFTTVNTNMP